MFLERMKAKIFAYLMLTKGESKKIALYVFLALTVRWGLAEAYRIPSESMNPTLKPGDHIMVNKAQYNVRIPFTKASIVETGTHQRGDVVVFRWPNEESTFFVKRIIGLPGEHIYVDKNGHVFINGEKQNERYIKRADEPESPIASFGPIVVPEGQLFVLGDNRNNSSDSRAWGFVPKANVLGKVAFKWFSWVD